MLNTALALAKKLSPVAAFLGMLLMLIFNLGAKDAGQAQLKGRVDQIEQQSVKRQEMDDLKQRLDRIEDKVDRVLLNQGKKGTQ